MAKNDKNETVQLTVTHRFRDKDTDEIHEVDEILDVSPERAQYLIEAGVAKGSAD